MGCAFICPAYLRDDIQCDHLRASIQSLTAQSDDDWLLIIIDDGSSAPAAKDLFAEAKQWLKHKLHLIVLGENRGQGHCRNRGIQAAIDAGASTVAFLDADDLAARGRVERIAAAFSADAELDFLYSGFELIDQNGKSVDPADAVPSIREILDALESPPCGRTAWRRIVVETGYVTLTSTVTVRIELAARHQFAEYYVSEDQHTWLRMTAASRKVGFDPGVKAQYRIRTDGSGSSVRARIGEGYYEQKAWVDSDGFFQSLDIALRQGHARPSEAPGLASRFLARCAATLSAEGLDASAERYRKLSKRAFGARLEDLPALKPPQPPMFSAQPRRRVC